jgi:hypothetical protein
MSERRQNNKKPLQKHTRKVTKLRQSEVWTIPPPKTLSREQKQVTEETLALLVSSQSRLLTWERACPSSSERSQELRLWGLRNLTWVLRIVGLGGGTVPGCSETLGRGELRGMVGGALWKGQSQAGCVRVWGLFQLKD